MTKSIRGGKVFIDYMRNSLEQTSVAGYSTRARPYGLHRVDTK
jgi:DNA primase